VIIEKEFFSDISLCIYRLSATTIWLKQNFPENNFEYFELLKFRKILILKCNFDIMTDCRRIKACTFKCAFFLCFLFLQIIKWKITIFLFYCCYHKWMISNVHLHIIYKMYFWFLFTYHILTVFYRGFIQYRTSIIYKR